MKFLKNGCSKKVIKSWNPHFEKSVFFMISNGSQKFLGMLLNWFAGRQGCFSQTTFKTFYQDSSKNHEFHISWNLMFCDCSHILFHNFKTCFFDDILFKFLKKPHTIPIGALAPPYRNFHFAKLHHQKMKLQKNPIPNPRLKKVDPYSSHCRFSFFFWVWCFIWSIIYNR